MFVGLDVGVAGGGVPDWGRVGKDGFEDGLVCDHQCLLLVAPFGAGESFEDVEAGAGSLFDFSYVWGEGELGVEPDS